MKYTRTLLRGNFPNHSITNTFQIKIIHIHIATDDTSVLVTAEAAPESGVLWFVAFRYQLDTIRAPWLYHPAADVDPSDIGHSHSRQLNQRTH